VPGIFWVRVDIEKRTTTVLNNKFQKINLNRGIRRLFID